MQNFLLKLISHMDFKGFTKMPNFNLNSKIINIHRVHTKRLIAVGKFTQKNLVLDISVI